MTHNVKEAKEEAFKTVERYASKKNNCVEYWALHQRRAPSLLNVRKKKKHEKHENHVKFIYNRKSYSEEGEIYYDL